MLMVWTDEAWEDYLYWQHVDKRMLKKVNALIKDIDRNGDGGWTGHAGIAAGKSVRILVTPYRPEKSSGVSRCGKRSVVAS